jgi:hypothetical protein
MKEHVYTSSKGEFLTWDQWAHTTLTKEELKIYLTSEADGEPIPAEKQALYARWLREEKIISHTEMEDGEVIMEYDL